MDLLKGLFKGGMKSGKKGGMKTSKKGGMKTAKKGGKLRKTQKKRRRMRGGADLSEAYPSMERKDNEEESEEGFVEGGKAPLMVVPMEEGGMKGGMKSGKKGGNVAVPVVLAAANFMGPKKAKKGGKKTQKRRRRH